MKSWRKFAFGLVIVAASGVGLFATRFVGLNYVRLVENDPLNAPVHVARLSDGHLELDDGRRVQLVLNDQEFSRSLQESGNWIELQHSFDDHYDIYVKRKTFICGTSFPAITIPVIASDVPKYRRVMIDSGQIMK